MSVNPDVATFISRLPCQIQLPASYAEFFEKSGPLCASYDESRRLARFYRREKAALTVVKRISAELSPTGICQVYLKDMSRAGVCFLHSGQLYPLEEIELVLASGERHQATIVRCRKIAALCYETAARLCLEPRG